MNFKRQKNMIKYAINKYKDCANVNGLLTEKEYKEALNKEFDI